MKYLTFVAVAACTFANCTSARDPATQQALTAYRHFIDSVYASNEVWKNTTDTVFVETPYDPEDPTLTRVDTIIRPPASKTTVMAEAYQGKLIMEAYQPLKAAIDQYLPQMDETMKKEYETSRQLFESLMVK